MLEIVISILTIISVTTVVTLTGVGIFSVIASLRDWDREAPWNWHRGCKCDKCGKIYGNPYKVPEYCKVCGNNAKYKMVIVRWRPFKWEVLNETKKKD